MATLLQKAKAYIPKKLTKRVFNKEEIELANAWINGEVGSSQVLHAMGYKSTGNIYTFVASAMRQEAK